MWYGDFPILKDISDTWQKLTLENKSIIEREIELLSINQRKILFTMASRGTIKEPYGKDFAICLNLSPSSIARALSDLIAKDYVYVANDGAYKILDPLINSVLASDEV